VPDGCASCQLFAGPLLIRGHPRPSFPAPARCSGAGDPGYTGVDPQGPHADYRKASMKPAAPLPSELQDIADTRWCDFEAQAQEQGLKPLALAEESRQELLRVWACSEFVSQSCIRSPGLLLDLVETGDPWNDYPAGTYRDRVAAGLAGVQDEDGLMAALRRLRRREMVRIAWRDLAGLASLEETTGDLSEFADAVLDGALSLLQPWLSASLGTPTSATGRPQSLVIIAMGKLGAHELNFSSDIDLIFAVPESGQTQGGRRELTNEEFFTRLGQRLIHALSASTSEGMVFRVDMRLRPFGQSGPLVMTFNAMEAYYQTHGREWERYALIKARAAAGDRARGQELLQGLQPFVFRRYLDYAAFESLRSMKALISQEVSSKGLQNDVKLGPGGIREVEFIAQAFQLIRGGREAPLRDRRLLRILERLSQRGHLPPAVTGELANAYRFLRDTEHRLQEMDDRQTQALPRDTMGRMRLAYSMGFSDWDAYLEALDGHRTRVQEHFQEVFALPHEGVPAEHPLSAVWLSTVDPKRATQILSEAGFDEPDGVLEALVRLRECYSVRVMSSVGRQRLDRLMPLILAATGSAEQPRQTLERVLGLIESVARRSVYLVLLIEHAEVLAQLVKLCALSPWISRQITRFPLLLDELLDPRSLYAPPDRGALERELSGQLADVPEGDMEQEMEVLRAFKQANVLRVAAADAANALPLMRVSDHLTEIAEVILQQVLALAWRDLARQYGEPRCRVEGDAIRPGFVIVAYGKLGGIELGYGSDLDLVFLHGSRGGDQHTRGERPVDNTVFFARLGKRLIHLLTTATPGGVLYEVDSRLRPSGAAGLMVASMEAFDEYQRKEAWTWEHQALVRARVVAGDEALAERFRGLRRAVLCRPRDPRQLREEVSHMRERMRTELSKAKRGEFDLKQDAGGIADIEFMVQYGVLLWAARHPEILRWTDNIRLLESFASAGLLPEEDEAFLADAYRAFRAQVHIRALQERPAVLSKESFRELRAGVIARWQRLLGEPAPGGR
jgi:glutamate-ammonia-ligase adenylyltransferase